MIHFDVCKKWIGKTIQESEKDKQDQVQKPNEVLTTPLKRIFQMCSSKSSDE